MKLNEYSKECLIYLNYDEELTYEQIGLLCNVSKHTVYSWFKKLGIKGKNNQKKGFISLSEDIVLNIAEKNRKYTIEDYNGKSKIIHSQDFQNVQSEITFQCSCGNIFKRIFYTALKSKIDNVCNDCKSKYLSDLYKTPKYQKIIKVNSSERKTYNRSFQEKELYSFVASLVKNTPFTIEHSFPFNEKNYDIFIPELKIFIEYNGLSFHSEMLYYVFETKNLQQAKNQHREKIQAAKPNRVFMIWEDDWCNKQEIIKNQIKFLICGPEKRLFARKTKLFNVSKKEADSFYDKYHIQGKTIYSVSYGLYFDCELVACMSFEKRKESYELVRYCSKDQIIGGFSKLVKHFVKEYMPENLYSFADLGMVHENNNVYKNNGWIEDSVLSPDYKYIFEGERHHKFGFRHKHLSKKLSQYNPEKSEYENCLDNKIYRIWDCGKIKYSYPLANFQKYK